MNPRIKYVTGDAAEPQGEGAKLIAHCVSNNGKSYGKGFALQLARKWPQAKRDYKHCAQIGDMFLGRTLTHRVAPSLFVIDLCAQHNLGPTSLQLPYLQHCLEDLTRRAIELNASVHMPRIGCGLAGGKWQDVEPLILAAFNLPLAQFVPVTVYDLPK